MGRSKEIIHLNSQKVLLVRFRSGRFKMIAWVWLNTSRFYGVFEVGKIV
jgi:hypothetical protein